ncbi:MAG: PSD1 and planctomycete cytochrome C domain-containing protein [Planctomycetes bacterium]|nr:PSD1 and planctomycete cytochrome C domain-containing protein [Planctomycetota bacterium]
MTRHPHHYLLGIALAVVASGASPTFAADPVPTPEDVRFFEMKIRPLLAEKCFKCHGAEKQRGELRLDTAEGVRKGGDSGEPLIAVDKPEKGTLLRAVRHEEGVPAMPPKAKLKDSEIADLAAWVKRGAPFPASVKVSGDTSKHWAFQPVVNSPPPTVKDGTWAKSDLDRFILAKLEAAQLKPAVPADKRTLIRRATFDLIGLPPTPEEIDAFLKDASPDAFATVVDRLLASNAYGERWGRHWLDVARYADSNGLDENTAHGNAWRYRDYVIASFNADKPYDRFLLEQIAGDLLGKDEKKASSFDPVIATGFLALGPKVLAEPDEKKMEFDIVDEQIDTLGKTVMGLTLGCARCHDHKFDPVSTADYYGLAGVFISTKTMETFKKVARWHENSLATPADLKRKADHDAEVAKLKALIKGLTAKTDEPSKVELKKLKAELAELEKKAPELPAAMGVTEGKPTDVPVLRRGNHLTPGEMVARRFPVVIAGAKQAALPNDHSGRLELAKWMTDPKHPLTARVMVNRVWRWHFGQGLVRSVDNFGLLSDKPSHPELLDSLAVEFVQSGWSLKALHRRIMLSATYQMSSTHDAKAAVADPDNRLHWRSNIRRLEAEAIRDSLLAVGGLLDRTAGGPALTHLKNRDYIFDHTSKDKTSYASHCRSVYLPVIRNNLYDVFQLFDAPDASVPNGDRPTTTVPTQSLFFLNSELVASSAGALADQVLSRSEISDDDRVRQVIAMAYGRQATTKEIERLTAAVAVFEKDFATSEADAAKRRRKAWSVVCQTVLASNEFIHIR